MENTKNEHLQPDFGTAAFLPARGFRLLGLSAINGRRYGFGFADSEKKAREAALCYLQGDSVPARRLIEAEKSLKTMLYSAKDGNWNENGEKHEYESR
jgi:hypothetical protein